MTHWFVWFIVGAMATFLAVLGLVTVMTHDR
jgi:hypothetical protein